jgi:hypothetical protein
MDARPRQEQKPSNERSELDVECEGKMRSEDM